MKKFYLFLFLISSGYLTQAQVKIGDNSANVNASSVLEIESTNKGLLFPRVGLTSTASPNPLASFVEGMTVYNTATAGTGTTAVSPGLYFSDGTKWLAVGAGLAIDQSLGSISAFPFSAVPSTYLVCDGSAVSRITYAALFSKIGITYGAGDGSTTFNLPDLRGEFIRGWDNGRGIDAGRVLGSSQTNATALPTSSFIVSTAGVHTHTVDPASTATTSDGSHTHSVDPPITTTTTNGDHSHTYTLPQSVGDNDRGTLSSNFSIDTPVTGNTGLSGAHVHFVDIGAFNSGAAGSHNHTVDIPSTTSSSTGNHNHTLSGGDTETRPRNVAMVFAIKALESVLVPSSTSTAITAAAAANEPWFKVGTGTGATSNTDDVYLNGNVGIGTTTPGARLEVSSGTAAVSGLRFSNINSSTTPIASGYSTLGVNASGDVVVVNGANTVQSGDVLQVKVFSGTEIPGTYDSGLINGTFTIPSFTPKSSNSTILVEADATYFVSGVAPVGTDDHFSMQLRQGGTTFMDKRQVWQTPINHPAGGTRSSTLFPIMGRFSNTSTTAKSFNLTLARISGDDTVSFSNSIVVKITEIQN